MNTQYHRQFKPCRYGSACNRKATCNFDHPPLNSAGHNGGHYNPHPHQYQSDNRNQSTGKRQNFTHSYHQPYQNVQPLRNNSSFTPRKEESCKTLCKNFHMGSCKYDNQCKRLHQFHYKDPKALQRLKIYFDCTQDLHARLTKIKREGKQKLVLKQGSQVKQLQFYFEDCQLKDLSDSKGLPSKCEFYEQRDNCMYFSTQNELYYFDMGFHNIQTDEKVWIANSHNAKITGLIHWNENILLSASITGEIKLWCKDQQNFIYNKQASEFLHSNYNPNNLPLEILFLDVFVLDDVKIIIAGTNDGRLLTWSGDQFNFIQLLVSEHYNKVYKAKLIHINDVLYATVLAWNTQGNRSAVIIVNLHTSIPNVLYEVDSKGNFSKNLHLLECMDENIFIGNMEGEVTMFNLLESDKEKVGVILHKNPVLDVIFSTQEVVATGVKVKLVYILEGGTSESKGTIAIYLLK